MNDMTIAVLS